VHVRNLHLSTIPIAPTEETDMKFVHANKSRRIVRPAVTMLETVVGTTALLALLAMVTPSLTEARRQSKEVRCMSNLQRIAGAGAAYAAADSNELLIPVHELTGTGGSLGSSEWGGRSGAGEPMFTEPVSSKWGTQFGRGPGSRPLNAILYKGGFLDYRENPGIKNANWLNDTKLDLDVYRCPSDYGYSGLHFKAWRDGGLSSFNHYGNSYAASAHWIGVPGDDCTLLGNSAFMRPASEVPSPSRTLSYMENCGRFAWRLDYGIDGCGGLTQGPGDPNAIVRGWHGSPFTFGTAFVDGHVSRTHIRGHLHPQPNIGRYPGNDDPSSAYYFWNCVIIRGPDWQGDTLPATPIPTGFPCTSSDAIVATVE
jgi:hypothetical protein